MPLDLEAGWCHLELSLILYYLKHPQSGPPQAAKKTPGGELYSNQVAVHELKVENN